MGIEGVGSSCNGQPIRVNSCPLENALVMTGTSPYDKTLADKTFAIMKELFLHSRDIRRSGSAALEELKPTGIIATNGCCHEDVQRIAFRNL